MKTAIDDGISPMEAHAKPILWLDALVKIHTEGLDQSLTGGDASQSAVWSRDLSCLELSLALLQNVPPLKQSPEDLVLDLLTLPSVFDFCAHCALLYLVGSTISMII